MSVGRNSLVAALDIGTTKVCCFVAKPDGQGGSRVVGIGHQVSRGIKAGAVVDFDLAESAVRNAVEAAERMAEERVEQVIVNVTGAQAQAQTVGVEVAIAGHQIGDADLQRVLDQTQAHGAQPERRLLHAVPTDFTIDGNRGIRDPRGMFGANLGVMLNLVSVADGPLRNLELVVQRCHLEVADRVLSAYASGLATLVEDETDLGVTVLDMGGGTTGLSVFYGGSLVFADVIPVGGQHVTNDIARGLATPVAQAERLKTLYGSAIPSPSDEREMLAVPQIGEQGADAVQQVPRSMLVGIIQPRIEETYEMVRERLEASGHARIAGRRLVLTGGASQLTGARELAARVLDKQARTGRPLRLQGLAEATQGPAFATAAGLVAYSLARPFDVVGRTQARAASGRFGRFGRWLKENF